MKKTIIFILSLYFLSIQPSFAYLDPGSGSAIMSMIIGFFVAIGVILKTFWYKIKSIFRPSQNNEKDTNNK
jgi:O-antigen/teichoic acid export membrane protein|tara:strand:+ start:221 stop:433 length:213 start_codon:yes stop_codon:yes gene_type:complete